MIREYLVVVTNDHEKRIKELENEIKILKTNTLKTELTIEECCPHDQAITSIDKNEEQRPIRSLDILRVKYNLDISVEDIK
jgi:hypothetical protein